MSSTFLFLILVLFVAIYAYFKWRYSYWQKRNVLTVPANIPFGNLISPFATPKPMHESVNKVYILAKLKNERYAGYYFCDNPVFVAVDPDLIRSIISTDFDHFQDRGVYIVDENHPLSANVFALPGTKWRPLRAKLTPSFTSGKLKNMSLIMLASGRNMVHYIDDHILPNGGVLNLQKTLRYYTIDVIGSAAFGLDCNSFVEMDSSFIKYAWKVFHFNWWEALRNMTVYAFPRFAHKTGISVYDKDMTRFFTELVRTSVDHREKNGVARNDFLQLLIDLKNDPTVRLTFNELAAQCFVFFFAGFESSAMLVTFALYEMSKNVDIQERARDEVTKVLARHNGEITYETMKELKYIQQILNEAMRKYPAVPIHYRQVSKAYKVPDSDLVLEKGLTVFIPAYSLQYDEDYFPHPEKFDPERFSDENKHKIHNYSFIPFSEGPRNCLGKRFGLLQAQIGLTIMLKNYKFTLNPKTKPLMLDPRAFTIFCLTDIFLDVEKI